MQIKTSLKLLNASFTKRRDYFCDRGLYNQNIQTITIYDNILVKRESLSMTAKQ